MNYFAVGSESAEIDDAAACRLLDEMLAKIGPVCRVLLVPPDISRMHSWSGPLTCALFAKLAPRCEVEILPAVGTHEPMTPDEKNSPAVETLGKRVLAADRERGYVKASFVAGDNFINRGGRVFGGFLAAMLDTLCGHAVRLTHREPNTPQVTLELKTSYLKAMTGKTGRVRAEGTVLSIGRRVAYVEAKLTDAEGRLYATATSTLLVLSQ